MYLHSFLLLLGPCRLQQLVKVQRSAASIDESTFLKITKRASFLSFTCFQQRPLALPRRAGAGMQHAQCSIPAFRLGVLRATHHPKCP
jgi:hypothetical protein